MVSVCIILFPLPAEEPLILPAGTTLVVHAKVVVTTLLERLIPVVPDEQIVCTAGMAIASGVGLTVTTTLMARPWQPFAVGVIV